MIFSTLILLTLLSPKEQLWRSIMEQESSFQMWSYCKREDAVGVAQIRPCVLVDIKQFLGIEVNHTMCYDPYTSKLVWLCYTDLWIGRLGLLGTLEQRARIWNGGPYGWRKLSTLNYWNSVKSKLYLGDQT